MSAIAENLRRQRLPLLTIAGVLVLGIAAWAVIARVTSDHLTRPATSTAAPENEQAEWKFDYSQARTGKLTKAQQARYVVQKQKATVLIQDLYDGIFLEPSRLPAVIKTSLAASAAKSLRAERLGFPSGSNDVKTIKRKAHIALDSTTTKAAIGRVTVLAKAKVGERPVKIEHQSTLWMERDEKGWKVIAFDVKQKPVK